MQAVATVSPPAPTLVWKRLLVSEYFVLFLCLIYFVALAPFTPDFATANNLGNILSSLLPLLVVAIGLTVVLITGGIDLSVTSIIALTSVLGARVMTAEDGWLAGRTAAVPAGILIMVLVGAVIGLINGLCITRLRMPPFIVTLTSMMFFSGFAIWLTQSKNIFSLPHGFLVIGKNIWVALAVTGALALIAHTMLNRSLLGRWLYAIGQNSRTALISGVPVAQVTVLAYVISGVCAALAAVLLTGRLETGSPVLGREMLLDIIGAVAIGGTSLYGGKGKIAWTIYGVAFLALIDNSLNLRNVSDPSITMIKGSVILLAAVLDSLRNKLLARS
jgi:ribose/xylose/arabinose/galactoside ABC-type transport system permease subunit